jgi:hypothetical protein
MTWTMPQRSLQIVAFLLLLAAAGAFAMGIASAPQRSGRLPGQKMPGGGTAPAIEATEATPLGDERIEGPPPPTPEEKAKAEEAKRKAAEADEQDAADDADKAAPMGNAVAPPPVAPAGNAAPADLPAADEPPH